MTFRTLINPFTKPLIKYTTVLSLFTPSLAIAHESTLAHSHTNELFFGLLTIAAVIGLFALVYGRQK